LSLRPHIVRSTGNVVDTIDAIIFPGGLGGIASPGTVAGSAACRVSGTFPRRKIIVDHSLRNSATFATLVTVTVP